MLYKYSCKILSETIRKKIASQKSDLQNDEQKKVEKPTGNSSESIGILFKKMSHPAEKCATINKML